MYCRFWNYRLLVVEFCGVIVYGILIRITRESLRVSVSSVISDETAVLAKCQNRLLEADGLQQETSSQY